MVSPDSDATGGSQINGFFRVSTRPMSYWAAVFVLGATLMMNTMAKAVEFGKFNEFTLYNADEGTLKDEVIIVFHGFLSAMPNSAYKRLSNAFRKRFSVVGFNYDYFDIATNNRVFDEAWIEFFKGKKVIAAGTSLGGFWADHYAAKYGIDKVILVNPVVDPFNQLQQFIGRHYVRRRQKEIVVTASDIDNYRSLIAPVGNDISRMVVLTRDDEILDHRLAINKYGQKPLNQVHIFDKGGHTVNLREPRFMSIIQNFLAIEP